jgi:uncharacterized membrane protein YccC
MVAQMTDWLARYRWILLHSVRMTTASTAAFVSAYALGLPEALSAVITAIIVTQSNVGGSLRTAIERIVGSAFGAAYAIGVAFAIRPDDAVSAAAALTIALLPLSILAARFPDFRIVPITGAIVLLGNTGLQLNPLNLGAYRLVGVGLGCVVGLLVSVLVLPARASRSVLETADRIVGLLGEQLQALASGGAACQDVLSSKASETRDSLVLLAALVEEATHERRARLAHVPDGQRILRTLRRLRIDVDTLRRAAREAGSDAVHDYAAAPWQDAARSGAATLRSTCRISAGEELPDDFNTLATAVRDYRAAVEEMRQAGMTDPLSTEELGRLFAIGFALDQLRRDLDDLIDVARETSRLGKRGSRIG